MARVKLHRILSILLLLAAGLAAAPASARDYEGFGPLSTRNQNPVYLQFLQLSPRRAEVLPEGMIEARVDSAYSNLFEQGTTRSSRLNLDMEYWRLAPVVAFGVKPGLEVGIEIPFVHMSGGFLDGFIQKFHKAFGFPNGGRDQVPNNEFHYRLDHNGKTLFDHSPLTFGLGDISIYMKQQLTGEDSEWPAIALFADLKFPTGQSDRGVGSGTPDFGFGLALDASWKRLHGYVNVGGFVLGGNEALDGLVQEAMLQYMIAGELTLLPDWSLIVQIEGGTPLLTGTGIDAWDGIPMDLIVGFRGEERDLFGQSGDLIWQFGFAEDITSQGPSVDFTVYMSIGVRFDLAGRSRPAGDWLAKRGR